MAVDAARLKSLAPAAIVVAVAAVVVWAFAATVLAHTQHMGLPLDDSYIYLTYAKQFGRAQPFTYYPGGGYSAGSTSVLWPMLLAPFWTLGARGHALVWVSYGLCGVLLAATALGIYRFVRDAAGCAPVAAACAVMALAVAPFAFCALSGMEVALTSALLVATLLLLRRAPADAPPSGTLVAVLAATSLSRPEATLIVAGIAGVAAAATFRRTRAARPALRWLVPLAAPLAWITANKLLAGHWFPNTGIVKSHFYLPGFDWTYWRHAVYAETRGMVKLLFWSSGSPLVWPRAVAVAVIVGIVRAIRWARREHRPLAAAAAIGAPFAIMLAVVATSGVGNGATVTAYNFQNYRYVATAFPLLFVLVGFALAPPARWKAPWAAAACGLAAAFAYAGWPEQKANMLLFAEGASDTNAQVVAIGTYLHAKLPGVRVMLHDAGAIAYYGDGPVYDMLGLVTDGQAEIANNGPGSRFEFLERLPADRRPAYFAYYPSWLGAPDFFGEPLLHTPLGRTLTAKPRLAGGGDMQLLPAVWDHVDSGAAPIGEHAGWAVVDEVDVADLASEHAHHWTATLGRRHFGDPTARWSFVDRADVPIGLVIDGGRTIRDAGDGDGAREAFDVEVDPGKPVRLVMRTGGTAALPFQERIARTARLGVRVDDRPAGELDVAPPPGEFVELVVDLPPAAGRVLHVTVHASGLYRVFHWFVLQPT